jgi:hypothetical protein
MGAFLKDACCFINKKFLGEIKVSISGKFVQAPEDFLIKINLFDLRGLESLQ